jgi:hypothetical protein
VSDRKLYHVTIEMYVEAESEQDAIRFAEYEALRIDGVDVDASLVRSASDIKPSWRDNLPWSRGASRWAPSGIEERTCSQVVEEQLG